MLRFDVACCCRALYAVPRGARLFQAIANCLAPFRNYANAVCRLRTETRATPNAERRTTSRPRRCD
eukprot:2441102-Lingulodinium_polyedra.AAC.1